MTDRITLPSEPELIKRMMEFRIANIHTATPGQVISYNADKNTAVVQPLLKTVFVDADGSRTVSSAPELADVPVFLMRGGGFHMSFRPKPGNLVALIFCERSIDKWAVTGGEQEPLPPRKHDWSDAFAIPGFYPASGSLAAPEQLVIGSEDGSVEIRLDLAAGKVSVKGLAVDLAEGTLGVGRVGDQITISPTTDPAFFVWLSALSPLTVAPYSAPITGAISQGSAKVKAG